ncbi:MAG: hypothetical protein LOX97_11975 [Sphingomonas sp.]|nr:hypothetical protein [Sphingomonas sp.]
MARFDGNLKAAGEARLDFNELYSLLAATDESKARGRQDAIACLLSASEGWEEARAMLGGAFAAASRASWLKDGKE